MATYNELEQRIRELKSRTGKGSISPRETFELMDELLAKTKGVDMTAQPLVVVKSYDTLALANADRNPINPATNKPLAFGQLVSVTADGANNAVYRLAALAADGSPTWEKQAALGDMSGYAKTGGSVKTVKEVEDDLVQLAGITDGFIKLDKNLLNPSMVTAQSVLSPDGTLAVGTDITANYDTSDFIPVTDETGYKGLNFQNGQVIFRKVAFYSADKTYMETLENVSSFTTPINVAYVRVSFNNKEADYNVEKIGLFLSTVTEFEYYLGMRLRYKGKSEDSIATLGDVNNLTTNFEHAKTITAGISLDIAPSNNLLKPSTITPNSILSPDGTIFTGTDVYDTSDFIPVTDETRYKGLNFQNAPVIFRKVAFYSADKTYMETLEKVSSFTTPINVAYVRASFNNKEADYNVEKIGLFLSTVTEFEYFAKGADYIITNPVNTLGKSDGSIATISDIKNIIEDSNVISGGLQYVFNNSLLKLLFKDGTFDLSVKNSRGFDGNDMFNFHSYNFKGVSGSNGDDVAPIHALNTTIGANHGQPCTIATAPAHGLTNTDIGTEWISSDATKFYIMRIVSSDRFMVLSENKGTPLSPSFIPLSAGTLTKGEITLNVTKVTYSQLYPSIGKMRKKILRNGSEEITSGKGYAEYIDIVESYDILNVDDILNNIKARSGSSDDPVFTGSSVINIENIYRFLPNMAVLVFVNVRGIKTPAFSDIMAAQASRVGTNGVTQYYVPNSLPVNGYDFRKPLAVTWSNSVPALYFGSSAWQDSNNPPNRVIEYYNNIGFTLGILTTRGVGKKLTDYTARTFELRYNTGKVYPHPVEGSVVGDPLPVNSIFSMVMYRLFSDLAETRTGNRLSYFNFDLDNTEYIFVDYSGSMLDKVNVEKHILNGRRVEVVESRNAVLQSDTYNDGVYIAANYVEGETCYMILSVK